jgi:hypothetical protein
MRIALAISATDLHGTAFNDLQANQMYFETVDFKEPIIGAERDSGRTLSGRMFSHLIDSRRTWAAIISADELGANEKAFLIDFYKANFKFISIKTGANWGNYIEVVTDGGELPVTYLNELEMLPEITMKMTEAR